MDALAFMLMSFGWYVKNGCLCVCACFFLPMYDSQLITIYTGTSLNGLDPVINRVDSVLLELPYDGWFM